MKKEEYLRRRAKVRMASMVDDTGTEYQGKPKVSRQPKPTSHAWHPSTKYKGAYVGGQKLSQAQRVILGAH